jgi:hypothetical protein
VLDPDLASLELPPPKAELAAAADGAAGGGALSEQAAALLTARAAAARAAGGPAAAAAYEAELRANVAEYLPGILEILQTVDRSVLLLLKTNDCLRCVII